MYEERVEMKKNKFLPTEEDLHPDTHLIDNRFIKQLRNNENLNKYLSERPLDWSDNDTFARNLLDTILNSEEYKSYASIANPTYAEDKDFWRKIFKQYIYLNEELDDILEDESIFWNDDIETVETFVLKTIKQFSEENGEKQPLLPMFKDEEDKQYALRLLDETIVNEKKYRALIEKHTEKWDFDRIAFMDMIIMQVAVAEIYSCESIPTSVTLNEFIDIAKSYSTPKSGTFVNGILDAIVNEAKSQHIIFKN